MNECNFCGTITDTVCAIAGPFTPTIIASGAASVRNAVNFTEIPSAIDAMASTAVSATQFVTQKIFPSLGNALSQVRKNLDELPQKAAERRESALIASIPPGTLYQAIEQGDIYNTQCLGPELRPRSIQYIPRNTYSASTTQIQLISNQILMHNGRNIQFTLNPTSHTITYLHSSGSDDLYTLLSLTDWSCIELTPAQAAAATPTIDTLIANGAFIPSPGSLPIPTGPLDAPTGASPKPIELMMKGHALPYAPDYEEVSIPEKKAIAAYTTQEGHKIVNSFLRGGSNATDLIQANASTPAAIDAFIKDTLAITVLTASGLNKVSNRTISGEHTAYRCMQLTPSQINTISQPGHIETMNTFSSCSAKYPSPTFWNASNTVVVIEGPPQGLFKDVSHVSSFAEENEVIGQAGIKLRTVCSNTITDPTNPLAPHKTAIFTRCMQNEF